MKKGLAISLLVSAMLALSAPFDAYALSLEQAARQAARQHNAKVLSARTINQGGKRVHVIKLLTKEGKVKTVRITDPTSGQKRR